MSDDTNADEALDGSNLTIAEVTVTGPGISIIRPVDEATMSSIIALLFGAAVPVSTGRGGGHGGGGGGGQGGGAQQTPQWDEDLNLGEFIVETGASTFQQKICAAGYFLMKFQGAESFSNSDVRTALADAHEDMPGNFSRDFGDAASKNLIAGKQGESGRYIIPRTGRTAVESNFTELPKRRARKTAKKSSSSGGGE